MSFKLKNHSLTPIEHATKPWVCFSCQQAYSDTEVMHGVMVKCTAENLCPVCGHDADYHGSWMGASCDASGCNCEQVRDFVGGVVSWKCGGLPA